MSTKDLIRKIALRCTAADEIEDKEEEEETEVPDWRELHRQVKPWDVFDYGADNWDVKTFVKFLQNQDIDLFFDQGYLSENSYESAKQILKDNGFDPSDWEQNEEFDELRFSIEEAARFNVDTLVPSPLFVTDPDQTMDVVEPTTNDDPGDDFYAMAEEFGFSKKEADKVWQHSQGGLGGIAVLTDNIKNVGGNPIDITGNVVLFIHDGYSGSGFYIEGQKNHTITFKTGKELAKAIDHGSYSLGDVFGGSADWKWR